MQLILLTAMTMLAFAGNSVLCRMALAGATIDAASFTAIRLASGALMLIVLMLFQSEFRTAGWNKMLSAGSWPSAAWLFLYATGFSFSYLSLSTATGALILFGMVQMTMMIASVLSGERHSMTAWSGYMVAVTGLVLLLWPGADPDIADVGGHAVVVSKSSTRRYERDFSGDSFRRTGIGAGLLVVVLCGEQDARLYGLRLLLTSVMILGGIAMVTMQRTVLFPVGFWL